MRMSCQHNLTVLQSFSMFSFTGMDKSLLVQQWNKCERPRECVSRHSTRTLENCRMWLDACHSTSLEEWFWLVQWLLFISRFGLDSLLISLRKRFMALFVRSIKKSLILIRLKLLNPFICFFPQRFVFERVCY